MRASVFGGSGVKKGEPDYQMAYEVGKALAKSGFEVVNGGYCGTMEAVSKGAKEEGGKVTGILCDIIRIVQPNEHLTDNINTPDLFERLRNVTSGMDLFVILPGGTGTLTELMLVQDLMGLGTIQKKPIVMITDYWKPVLEHVEQKNNILKKLEVLKFVKGIDEFRDFLEAIKNA